VMGVPVLEIDPAQPINEYVSLAEFETDGDTEGWSGFAVTAEISGGIAAVTATDGDPQIYQTGLSSDMAAEYYAILDFRLRRSDYAQSLQIFWGDDSGGFSELRSLIIPAGAFLEPVDDFHVYQIHWSGSVQGILNSLRLDDGDSAGRLSEFDYIRLGRVGSGT